MANVFCIGNGTSRKGFDLETLKPFGKTYACNAIYKDFIPDVLITVDQGIMHEVYHSGYAQRHEMWCRGWTKVPAGTYKLMLNSGLPQEEVDKLLEDDILVEVSYSAINDYDWSLSTGKLFLYRLLFGLLKLNFKPGMQMSGVVKQIGTKRIKDTGIKSES